MSPLEFPLSSQWRRTCQPGGGEAQNASSAWVFRAILDLCAALLCAVIDCHSRIPTVDDERGTPLAPELWTQPEPNVGGVCSTRTKSLRMSIPPRITIDSTTMANVSPTTIRIRRTVSLSERTMASVTMICVRLSHFVEVTRAV